MALLDRHIEFVEALRTAGLPVSLSEGLDAVAAIDRLGLGEREVLRAAYAATLLKRHSHRTGFDQVFDLYFPALVGEGIGLHGGPDPVVGNDSADAGESPAPGGDGPQELADFRVQLTEALAAGDPHQLAQLARDGVARFGLIRGRGPGEQRWSSYNVTARVAPAQLVEPALRQLLGEGWDDDPAERRYMEARLRTFERLVDTEVRRRAAEVRGPENIARHTVAPAIEQLSFTHANREDLAALRREIQPLARRLAARLAREQQARRRGPLDFRRTVRASMSSGGVPLETHHRPRRPSRPELVVLCDVSGSVANFAAFTLMLVFALREQFSRVRAFTFVDEIHEITDQFVPGADPADTLAALVASARHASLWGRTSYGRAFTRFAEEHPDALTPKTHLLVLGDARSNHSDLALPVVQQLVRDTRKSWWLNPEPARNWDTGDSAASEYGALIPMVECRNLVQLGEFIHDLA